MLTVVPLALVAVVLAPSETPAAPQVEMCQGQPVTIVSNGSDAEGTNGPDVIVAVAGAFNLNVDGRGGADLICVSGNPPRGWHTYVDGGNGVDSLELTFGNAANSLVVQDVDVLDIDLGDGFDRLRLDRFAHGSGRIDGGGDSAALSASVREFDLDLMAGVMATNDGDGRYSIDRFRQVRIQAGRVVISGDAQANRFKVNACVATVRGGRGGDTLVNLSPAHRPTFVGDCRPKVRLIGQAGDDRLTGSSADDVLVGGRGRDRADGRTGTDRCVAEKETNCER